MLSCSIEPANAQLVNASGQLQIKSGSGLISNHILPSAAIIDGEITCGKMTGNQLYSAARCGLMVPGTSYCYSEISNRQIWYSMLSSAEICPELCTFLEVCLPGFVLKCRIKRRGGGGRCTWGHWKQQITLRLFNNIDLMMTLTIIVVENLTQTNNCTPVTSRRH